MTPAELKKLIEKFYKGETSEVAENSLRDWFQREDISEEFSAESEYFRTMYKLKEESLGASFEEDLLQKIKSEKLPKVIRFWPLGISSIAATIMIFLAIWFGTDLLNSNEVYGTIKDPQIAFHESQRILEEVSKKLDKGLKPAQKTVEKVEENVKKTGEINKLNEAIKKAKPIHKIDNASELLKSFNKVYVNYGKS